MLEFFRDERKRERERGRETRNTGRKRKETRHDRAREWDRQEGKRSRRKIFRDSVVGSRRSDVVKSRHRIYDVSWAKMQTIRRCFEPRDSALPLLPNVHAEK